MFRNTALAILLAVSGMHAESVSRRLWRASIAALVAGNAADMASSWGRYEANPLLGRGRFGVRQAGIKAGVVGVSVAAQTLLVRRRAEKPYAVANFAAAAALGAVAAHNLRYAKVVR